MRSTQTWGLAALTFVALATSSLLGDDRPALEMSKAVVCKKIVGYEEFEADPDASITAEDKLQIYFRPLNFRVEGVEKPRPGHRFKASLVEDCRLRRKGEKAVLMKKDRIVEFDPTFETSSERLYMMTKLGLKGLTPGEYELDIVLHDGLEPATSATQTVSFTILPTPKLMPPPIEEKPGQPEG